MKKTACIFGSGEYGGVSPKVPEGAFVIAADGGYDYLKRTGMEPDLLVGDFDSLTGELPEDVALIRHPVMKDETDMALAIREAERRGAERFLLYGALGGRLDHTLGNIQLLVALARRGREAWLLGPRERVTAIRNGALAFPEGTGGTVSVFAYGGVARGVTETGLLYPLENADLPDDVTLGVSNEFTGEPSRIQVRDGTLIVILSEN